LFGILVGFHVLVCLALIAVVLMQSSKGEGLAGSSFAGGMSGAVFGGRGAGSILSKATTVLAVVFFLSCGGLAFLSAGMRVGSTTSTTTGSSESAVTKQAQEQIKRQQEQQQQQPAQQALPVDTAAAQPAQPAGK
jgi:preprotein translocase subunit SecG